jgi:hypothetical protein
MVHCYSKHLIDSITHERKYRQARQVQRSHTNTTEKVHEPRNKTDKLQLTHTKTVTKEIHRLLRIDRTPHGLDSISSKLPSPTHHTLLLIISLIPTIITRVLLLWTLLLGTLFLWALRSA